MENNNLIDLKIKNEFFNTKFLFYNYYQFNKQKKIPINYRTPYCILDGIYLEPVEFRVNKIIKQKNHNKIIIQFIIPENNNICNILHKIDIFNYDFFKNIKLSNNIKKKRTIKHSSSSYNYSNDFINNQNVNENNNFRNNENNENDNNDFYNNANNENDNTELDNIFNNDEINISNNNNLKNIKNKYEIENNRFSKIDKFIKKNKYYEYKSFLEKYDNNYLLNCEIKPEFCQKLFYKLRTNFNFTSTSSTLLINKNKNIQNQINICNDIIKLTNLEFFKFNTVGKEWDCKDWNIDLLINLKSNIFETCIDNDTTLNMIWKICSFNF
jgi:hypothetical protein